MNPPVFHPAIGLLLRFQARARVRRIFSRLRRPRRIVLSIIAAVLLCAWLGNAVLSVLLRESTDIQSLRTYLALAFSTYFGWHVVRVACFRPEYPLEMTTEDRAVLEACPLRPADLVGHHLAGTLCAAIFKAGCVALLLVPDLPNFCLGLCGMFIALWTIDLLRISLEIVTWGMSRRLYLAYRTIVLIALATAVVLSAGTIREATFAALSIPESDDPLESIQIFFGNLQQTSFAEWSASVWNPILEVVAAEHLAWSTAIYLACSTTVISTLLIGVFRLYSWALHNVACREQREFARAANGASKSRTKSAIKNDQVVEPLATTTWLLRLNPLAWRQMLGAKRYAGGLFTAMAVPAALSLLPTFAPVSNESAFLSTVGGLAFYSFLLLPTALKFDFRRDLDRFAMIKSLPIRSSDAAVGQVAAPVIVASMFQWVVIAIALISRPVPMQIVFGSVLMLTILNVLIFALENLIFLWYPHQLRQEGLEIFIRTTLTFTAKGLFFVAALALVVAWSIPARFLADTLSNLLAANISPYLIYFLGIQILMAATALVALGLLARAFARFDPVEDQPR